MPAPRAARFYDVLLRVRMSRAMFDLLRRDAAAQDTNVSALVRELIAAGARRTEETGDCELAAVAALVATEHARLLLEAILPEAGRRSGELRQRAANAASTRLDETRAALAEGGRRW